jgi:hypothetical protein
MNKLISNILYDKTADGQHVSADDRQEHPTVNLFANQAPVLPPNTLTAVTRRQIRLLSTEI